jgi:hypothetical protein
LKRSWTLGILLGIGCSALAPASEGRIPIAAPTTLTGSGSYVLTRNIQFDAGDIITIDAPDVTLDLDGHVLSSTSTTHALISVGPAARSVTLRDGRLSGDGAAIAYASGAGVKLRMEDLVVDGASGDGIVVYGPATVELLNSRLVNNDVAMLFPPAAGAVTGRIAGNTIGGGNQCLALNYARNMEIVDNMITNCGNNGLYIGQPSAPAGSTFAGNIVQHNTFANCGVGAAVFPDSPGNQIVGNVFIKTGIGVAADSASNRIAGNTIFGSNLSSDCDGGVCVTGPRNLVEGNQIGGAAPGCGIIFYGAAALDNSYRNNMLRGNGGGAVCFTGGATATNDGGNVI